PGKSRGCRGQWPSAVVGGGGPNGASPPGGLNAVAASFEAHVIESVTHLRCLASEESLITMAPCSRTLARGAVLLRNEQFGSEEARARGLVWTATTHSRGYG